MLRHICTIAEHETALIRILRPSFVTRGQDDFASKETCVLFFKKNILPSLFR